MAFSAVLDGNVLYPASLRDTLLRFASRAFFVPVCTDRILDEVERNIVADGRASVEGAERLRSAMTRVFADAWIDDEAISGLEPAMTNHAKDRHVLAAAVASEAQTIVTQDRPGFPETSVEPYGIQVQHPDEFLLGLFALSPELAVEIVRAQAAALKRPPLSIHDILAALATAGAPDFAATVLEHLPVAVADR